MKAAVRGQPFVLTPQQFSGRPSKTFLNFIGSLVSFFIVKDLTACIADLLLLIFSKRQLTEWGA